VVEGPLLEHEQIQRLSKAADQPTTSLMSLVTVRDAHAGDMT